MEDNNLDLNFCFSCIACKRPDAADNLVACDKCDNWWHYSCAGVSESVVNRIWVCAKCVSVPPMAKSSRSSTSKLKAQQLELKLKRLEEQHALEKKEQELEKRYMQEKYELLEKGLLDEEADNCSFISEPECHERVQNVAAWVENQVPKYTNNQSLKSVASVRLSEIDRSVYLAENPMNEEVNVAGVMGTTQLKPQQNVPSAKDSNSKVKPEAEQQLFRLLQHKMVRLQEQQSPSVEDLEELKEQWRIWQLQLQRRDGLCSQIPYETAIPKRHVLLKDIVEEKNDHDQGRANDTLVRSANVTCDVNLADHFTSLRFDQSEAGNQSALKAGDRPIPLNTNPVYSTNTKERHFDSARSNHGGAEYLLPVRREHATFQRANSEQLAARQVMPRDLPEFSGEPEQWPIFISSYNNSTAACGYSNSENLARLQRSLKGGALKSVRYYLLTPESVPDVIKTLHMLYGRPEVIVNKLIKNVLAIPSPKAEKLETLIEFGMSVRNLTQHLIAVGQHAHLLNPVLLQELVEKLPANIKLQWAQQLNSFSTPSLQTFSDFMSSVVESVSRVVLYSGNQCERTEKAKINLHAHDQRNLPTSGGSADNKNSEKKCFLCFNEAHFAKDCKIFLDCSVEDRWKHVQRLKLCRCCLKLHFRRSCRKQIKCQIDGCQLKHHPLLHSLTKKDVKITGPPKTESHSYHHINESVLFRIIPVILHGNSKSIQVFALLDEGSSATLVEQEIAEQLGVSGPNVPLCLKWTANMSRSESHSQVISLGVSAVGKRKCYRLENVRTVEHLNLPTQSLPFEEIATKFPHLKRLPVISYEKATPKLLLGLRDLPLAAPLKIIEGKYGPVATKTRLGWCVYGQLQEGNTAEQFNYHICDCESDNKAELMLKEYFGVEDVGTLPIVNLESEDDLRAKRILLETTIRVGDRYKTGLLWKCDHVKFPNSYPMAMRRLECLEKRLNRDPSLKENVHLQLQQYQTKGYAHYATEEELSKAPKGRVWYLPLGVVLNPKKPGKGRLIWDAAAKVGEVSLNSMLLPGPDLLVPLLSVLFRFRQYSVAVTGDIKEMFHQIQIVEADKHAQRFLWRNSPDENPKILLMDVATFGSACSPSSAQFVKNKNALEFIDRFPRAVEGILKCHYVDDYLDSFETVEEAQRVAKEVEWVHSKGGFQIHQWSTNLKAVLNYIGGKSVSDSKQLVPSKSNGSERVLGMLWQTEVDELKFSMSFSGEIERLVTSGTIPTKRQILKCVMSLFDPLGLLSHLLVHGKILMQDIWRTGIHWDERVNDELYERWKKWCTLLAHVNDVGIPRCYFKGVSSETYGSLQAHIFTDASETAYAAVVYFRIINSDGRVQCALVTAKAKVAPLKYTTIPRLELMAAVLGTRLISHVINGHSISVHQRFFWTDSNTVLAWIRSEHRRYRQFVACRIGEILTSTAEKDWRWVPSALNVADEATKWGKGPSFLTTSRWYRGPDFLYLAEEHWPKPEQVVPDTKEELRTCCIHSNVVSVSTPLIQFQRFSKWNRLLRTMAYVLRFVDACRESKNNEGIRQTSTLAQAELHKAEVQIWRLVQEEAYAKELLILSKRRSSVQETEQLARSSPLYKLTPMLDRDGVLRIDGRIGAAQWTTEETKNPVILPKDHLVTSLIIYHYHTKYVHGNSETVVNELRQRYYIPRLRVLVRKLSKKCQWCKVYKARPEVPKMAPLPAARLSPYFRPFSFIGFDYFGPILVKVGRSNAKRWIALFTCLSIRAIHLEVAFDLSTQSCIMCIRRFICRRGSPLEIYSDNGSNFIGADRILKQQIMRIEAESAATFTNARTKWLFIPPSTPHMGGAWERMVRSVKNAILNLPKERKLTDEALQTVMVEAESIVNSRPLTYLPLDSEEQEALTPNHFLLGSSSGIKQPTVTMDDSVKVVHNSWNLIQFNINYFWRRWIREYMPTLTKRTKWFGDTKPVEPGDLVIIIDDSKRNGWVRGRVLTVRYGQDGRARQALVQTPTGVFHRAVAKLALLEVNEDGKDVNEHPYVEGNVTVDVSTNALPEKRE